MNLLGRLILISERSLVAAGVCHAVVMDKAKKLAEEAEDRERMARIVKRHQKPTKKEIRPDDQVAATVVSEAPEHN